MQTRILMTRICVAVFDWWDGLFFADWDLAVPPIKNSNADAYHQDARSHCIPQQSSLESLSDEGLTSTRVERMLSLLLIKEVAILR